MTGFFRPPLVALACCLPLAGAAAHAAADVPQPADSPVCLPGDEANFDLRLERRFNVLAGNPPAGKATPARPASGAYPMFISADRIAGRSDDLVDAEGSVELRKTGQLIYADQLIYRLLDDEAEARGNVRLTQDGAEVSTPYMRMQLSQQVGFAEHAGYHIVKQVDSRFYDKPKAVVSVASVVGGNSGAPMMLNIPNSYGLPTGQPPARSSVASGDAERIEFKGENRIGMTQATYSTCKPGQRDWYLKTGEMDLDYDNNAGDARNASLWFKDVPIFYTPVAWFPLNQQRRSGVLMPSFSSSTRNGLDVSLPYYWNIAPNYDATLYPRYLSKRGLQLGVEARYMGLHHNGETRAEYLPDDADAGRERFAYSIRHQQNFGQGVTGALNLNGVSDDHYWEDLSSRLLQTSQTQLPRQAVLGYAPSPWLQTSVQVLRYQTLQPDAQNPVARPYFLEPQINLLGYRPNILKTDLSLVGQYTRFTHDDRASKDTGERFVLYPQVSLPIVHPAFQITPKLGLHMTSYRLDRAQVNRGLSTEASRVVPTFSLDSTVVFEREGKLLGQPYIQTLEPRLYYVYIPYRDQSRIPVFDTGLSDFNFAQMFSENRYSGYDRVNDANQLTAAVTTRLLDGETGAERFKAMLGQRYYFERQRVAIPGETARQNTFSNLVAAASGLVAPKTFGELAWEYNYKDRVNERLAAGVRFQPDYGRVLSASYRYTRDPLTGKGIVDQVDFAGQWPLASNWHAVGRYNYSLRDKGLLEAIGGFEYNAGCWAVRVVGQRLAAITGKPNDTLFLQLELNDFGSIGSNPLGLLRRSIPGYGKTNELPSDGNLISTY